MKTKSIVITFVLTTVLLTGCGQVAQETGLKPETTSMVDQEKTVQLSTLAVSPQDGQVEVGGKIQFRAIPYYGDTEIVLLGINVSWETNSQVGSIDSTGLFTALAEGTCEVKAVVQNLTVAAIVTVISPRGTASSALPTPKNLSVTGGDSFITLNWDPNLESNLKFYRLYRKSENESSFTQIATASAAAYVDADLTNNLIYSYKIAAVDTSGNESNFSNNSSLLFKDKIPPSPPQNLAGIAGNSSVTLSWDKNSEADFVSYQLYRKAGQNGSFAAAANTTSNSHQDSNLTNNTTYTYKLKAIDNVGNESGFSNELSLTPQDLDVPQAPAGLNATAKDSYIILSWRANSEADLKGYKLYRKFSDSDNFESVATLNKVTSYQDKNLTNDLVYEYALSAIDTSLNESQLSSNVSTAPLDMTAPAAPKGLSGAASAFYIDLSWEANTEEDFVGYNLYRGTLRGEEYWEAVNSGYLDSLKEQLSFTKINAVLISIPSFHDSSLDEATFYYYKITALDENLNESGMSPELEIYTLFAPPFNLTAEATENEIILSWEISGPFGEYPWDYLIEKRDSDGNLSTIETNDKYFFGNSFTDDRVEKGKVYYYKIAVLNGEIGGKLSEFSEEIVASLIVQEE